MLIDKELWVNITPVPVTMHGKADQAKLAALALCQDRTVSIPAK
ncbi:hypothetical protein [Raoultella terrigena]